jgi:MFS family permease
MLPAEVAPRRTIVVLTAVMALESADQGTVGATAQTLHDQLGLGTGEIGVLASAAALVGALASVPMGVLADRLDRVKLLTVSALIWSGAMVLVGCTSSFGWMLAARIGLGVVTATAGPAVASLVGDAIEPVHRGRVFGFILLGELGGTGVGLVLSGEIAGLAGWRWAYWWLAIPGLVIGWQLRRTSEPHRREGTPEATASPDELVREVVERAAVQTDEKLLLNEDPSRMRLLDVARYVFRIKTNVVLVVASTVGYYFFTGMRTFSVSYLREQFGLAQTTVSLLFPIIGVGAVAGVVVGGLFGDRMLHRGHPAGRVIAVLVAYFGAVVFLVPGLLVPVLTVGLPLLLVAAAFLGAANPPLDAARIDIMPVALLGRAEGLRTMLRNTADASAPAVFGVLAGAIGMRSTFLVMLVPLLAGGCLGLAAVRTYPRDVATALANNERLATRGRTSAGRS